MMEFVTEPLSELLINFDSKRIPLSSRERESKKGHYPYYGATSILDYVDEYIFDGTYILLGEDGTVINEDGSPVLQLVNGKFWCNNHAHILRNTDKVDFYFLYYLLKNCNVTSIVTGAVQPKISQKNLYSFIVTYPKDKSLQRKIVSILKKIDDKIELNQRQNNNLEQQAQTIFKSIYSTENNGILADIVNIAESGSRPKGGALNRGIPSIGAENIEKFGVYDYSKEKFISEEFYNQMKRGKVLSEDVLLYKDGAYTGKVSLALDGFPHKVCAVNEHVFIIRGKPNISSQFFIYFCLSYEANKNYLHTLACSKAAQPGLNQSELLGLPIFIPLPDTIKKFTNIVSPLMHKIAANALENIKLASLRDTLLPKLMKGEIDVSNVDISDITSADKLSFSEDK